MAITPQWLMDFESRMSVISESEQLEIAKHLWWDRVMRVRTKSDTKKQLISWFLTTASIEDRGQGGNYNYDDVVALYAQYTAESVGKGFKIRIDELEDKDANGVMAATEWSAQIAAQMAYWPQQQLVSLIKNGETATGYDGQPFFSTAHPQNPYDTSVGTFQNLLTGGASGVYPGACPIDDSVSVDVALTNLSKVVAFIRSIKMPNGIQPRFLKPEVIFAGPRMQQRIVQLTNAKFIAQVAGSSVGAGSGDVEALIQSLGFIEPIIADEFAGFENDTTWFLGCRQMSTSQLGAFVYIPRKEFRIDYYTGEGEPSNVNLGRAEELEWLAKGRNSIGPGHPFLFFKIKAS